MCTDILPAVSYYQILCNDDQQLVFSYIIINNVVPIRLLSAMTLFFVDCPQEELTLEGYNKHLESQKAAPPLTDAEHELKLLRESEVSAGSTL